MDQLLFLNPLIVRLSGGSKSAIVQSYCWSSRYFENHLNQRRTHICIEEIHLKECSAKSPVRMEIEESLPA